MAPTVERKLTTILCADVCGYSRQMGMDEEGTLKRLKGAREVFKSIVHDYSGRIVNMTGDGLVVEFGSVVQAVNCAVDVQNHFNNINKKNHDPSDMIFRVGLNLGDVIIEGEDIFGEGVNVAARLESMTPPGGICLSGTVYDHVKGKFPDQFDFLGNKSVKNIEEAIPVYSLSLASTPKIVTPDPIPSQSKDTDAVQASPADKEEQEIRDRIKKQAAFYRRGMKAVGLVLLLFLINIVTSPSHLWFYWPALPIAVMLALDAMRVFGTEQMSANWEEKKLAELKSKKNHH